MNRRGLLKLLGLAPVAALSLPALAATKTAAAVYDPAKKQIWWHELPVGTWVTYKSNRLVAASGQRWQTPVELWLVDDAGADSIDMKYRPKLPAWF